MIELNSKIKDALIKIDFIKRYEELSNKFNAERTPPSNRLVYIDGEEVKKRKGSDCPISPSVCIFLPGKGDSGQPVPGYLSFGLPV